MKSKVLSILMAGCALAVAPGADLPAAGHRVRTLAWSEVPLPQGSVLSKGAPGGKPALIFRHAGDKPSRITLAVLDAPGVAAKCYAFRGKIRCKEMSGTGYVETWNEFPPEATGQAKLRAFTRTLAQEGPMEKLAGTQDWRDLFVPFNATDAKNLVSRIEMNLVLDGAGEVEISDLELLEYPTAEALWSAVGIAALPKQTATPDIAKVSLVWVFLAGAGIATVVLTTAGAAIVWWKLRQKNQAEIRRMKALDLS